MDPISLRSPAKERSYASDFARMSASPCATMGKSSRRMSSRKRRRRRLRSTAVCLCLGTIRPTRAPEEVEAKRTSRVGVCIFLPRRRRLSISVFRTSLFARGKRRVLRSCVLRRELDCQALPALLPAPAQNFTPPLRCHAGAESVCPDATLVAGTICRLTHSITAPNPADPL